MTPRVDPFASLREPVVPVFTPRPRQSKPVEQEVIARIAEENNFPSREPVRRVQEPRRQKRLHRTGRNQQFNIKAKDVTIERFYRMADERNVVLGELLELALDALEKTTPPSSNPTES
jgi:hypothetical protein